MLYLFIFSVDYGSAHKYEGNYRIAVQKSDFAREHCEQ